MARRLTTEEALLRMQEAHNNEYTYPNFVHKSTTTKVTVVCRQHGEFYPSYSNHVNGSRCPTCAARDRGLQKRARAANTFTERAQKVHGSTYDYSKVEYVDSVTPVTIVCQEHGEFEQTPGSHLNGSGCSACGYMRAAEATARPWEDFIAEALKIHGDRFDYSKAVYSRSTVEIEIICNGCERSFYQLPYKHTQGQGCPYCRRNRILTMEEFIRQSTEVHGDFYDYSKTIIEPMRNTVVITCPEHGDFEQYRFDHMSGHGCRECFDDSRTGMDFDEYLEKYGKEWYTYNRFTDYFGPLEAVCLDHGHTVKTTGHAHAVSPNGGCPECRRITKLQRYLIDNIPLRVEANVRTIIPPKEIDLYYPDKSIGIELNGVFWHKDKDRNYHQDKTDDANRVGVKLFHIWEESGTDFDLVLSVVKAKLGLLDRSVYARKCEVAEISPKVYAEFLDRTHLQGKTNSRIKYGLFLGKKLEAVMGFSQKQGGWTLDRFSSERHTAVVGGFSKLLSHFIREHAPRSITTYSDAGYSDGGVYQKNGFTKSDKPGPVRMWYTDGKTLLNRRMYQRKYIKERRPDIPWGPEKEMAGAEGVYQVFGNRTTRWELTLGQ